MHFTISTQYQLLELGGKNPCFVTKNAHIPSAAMVSHFGKVYNHSAKQTPIHYTYLLSKIVQNPANSMGQNFW